jgi:DNA repair exonuclease SbcCD ATPase subunit
LRINKLSIENFRNHKKTELNLDRINFFVGGNNAGKTSILAAIEWGLTGRCMWTDRAGRGAADLVRQGEKHAIVAMEVAGLGAVVRSLPPHTLQAGKVSGVNEGQAAIYNALGAAEDRLRVALNAGAFVNMSQAEQRAFLFNAYGLTWTVDQVAAELAGWLAKKGLPEGEAERLAKKARSYYPTGIACGPEIFDAMEKRAKEERKEQKKDRQRIEAALAEIDAASLNQALPEGLEDLKNKLAGMKKRRDELLKACGAGHEMQSRRQSLEEKISQAEKKASEARAKAESLAAELESLGGLDKAACEPGTDDMEKEFQEKVDAANKAVAAARSKLEAIDKAGQALACKDRRCPLAPELLQCGLTKDQLDAVLLSLRREYRVTSQDLEKQKTALKEATEKLAEMRKSREESQARARRAILLQGELKTRRQVVETLEIAITDLRKELAGLPEEDLDLLEDLANLEVAIRRAESDIALHSEAEALAGRKTALEQDAETLAAEVADLEALVKALGPDGLRRDMLAGILEGFVGRVNDRLGRLTEGAYQVALGGDMAILCRANGGPVLPLRLLSRSEQLRAGIAISDALSAAAGLKFLAIDEADILEQDNRDLLSGMLLELAEEYDQVLVFTTVGDVQPVNPGLPGVKMFWVEEGFVKEI